MFESHGESMLLFHFHILSFFTRLFSYECFPTYIIFDIFLFIRISFFSPTSTFVSVVLLPPCLNYYISGLLRFRHFKLYVIFFASFFLSLKNAYQSE